MNIPYLASAAFRALTAAKDGPSLYDLCDPIFLGHTSGDPHIAKFYKTALGNVALRPLLRKAGLPELRDPTRFKALQNALIRARDDEAPDWAAVGQPVDPHCMIVNVAVPGTDFAPGTVVQEIRRGYRWKGKVLRYAEVGAATK